MAKLQHLQAILALLGLELLLTLKVPLARKALETLDQEPRTKRSAP
jgi:hypothetical protein